MQLEELDELDRTLLMESVDMLLKHHSSTEMIAMNMEGNARVITRLNRLAEILSSMEADEGSK